MAWCRGVTDAAFVHLRGIHTLDMSSCSQRTITDAAFAHLTRHSYAEHVRAAASATITDAAFAYLAGIHTLHMSNCMHQQAPAAASISSFCFTLPNIIQAYHHSTFSNNTPGFSQVHNQSHPTSTQCKRSTAMCHEMQPILTQHLL